MIGLKLDFSLTKRSHPTYFRIVVHAFKKQRVSVTDSGILEHTGFNLF